MLPQNRKDEEDEVRTCVDNLAKQLNEINAQYNNFPLHHSINSLKKKDHEEKLALEKKANKTEEDIKRLQVLTYLEENSETPEVKETYEKTLQFMRDELKY
jgi:predicted transcriptional regulator